MKTAELIQSYQAIYNTLDGLTVRGIENCNAVSYCATHIQKQKQLLQEQLQAEQAAEEAAKQQIAAAQANAREENA